MSTIKISKVTIQDQEFSYTDQFFKFPTTLHLTKDPESDVDYESLGIKSSVNTEQGVVGIVRCLPEDIVTWWDTFSKFKSIEQVEKDGFDMTHVQLRNGEEFSCMWDRKTFENKLNLHVKMLVSKTDEAMDELEKLSEKQKDGAPSKGGWFDWLFGKK